MICRACGADNPPTNRFCGQCGARLEAAVGAGGPPSEGGTAEEGAERRQLTVMFCDMVGSTALSARLDPEDLREVMQAYRDAAVAAIARYDGRIAKYLGDGILAYFGYPNAHDDDAARAVGAGLAIVEAMPALEARVGVPRGVELKCRVGIATGPVVVGEMGAGERREAMAVIGETPNLADRIQKVSPPNTVVIAPLTRQLVEARFAVAPLGSHELRGLARPLEVYRVIGRARRAAALPRLPLTGRDAELAALRAAFERARRGEGGAIVVSGEPGIGKTRLLKALKNEAVGRRALWLEAQCSPYHADTPLYPATELLSRALGLRRNEAPSEKLSRLVTFCNRFGLRAGVDISLLATMLSIPDQGRGALPNLSLPALRVRTLETVVALLARLAKRRPLVLAVEDLHWADASTLDLLDLLLAALPGQSLLVLLTHRPDFVRVWPREASVEELTLGRLQPEDGVRLIGHVAGEAALPPGVVSTILSRSDGVPLFVEEITRTLIEMRKDLGPAANGAPPDAAEIPATLKDSLMARLDRLGEGKEVAQVGAAIGRNFVYELLASVAGLDEPRLRQALGELEAAGLIQARGEPPSAIYTFRHALIREIAYDSMLRRRRQSLHGAIARALEAGFPEIVEMQPDLLGRHFAQAGDRAKAADYFEQAGRRAALRSAHIEASRHFRRAIELVESENETLERDARLAELWAALAPSLLVSRGYGSAEVGDAFRKADELSRRLGDPERQFYSAWGIGAFHYVTGDLPAALAVIERMEATAVRAERDDLRAITVMSRGVIQFLLGRFDETIALVERGLSFYDPEQGRVAIARIGQDLSVLGRGFCAVSYWAVGRPDKALDMALATLEHARAMRHAYSIAFALTAGVSLVRFRRGEVEDAMAAACEAVEIARENQFPYLLSRATAMRGLIETRTGMVEQGLAHINEGIAAFIAVGGRTTLPMMRVWLADGLLSAGDPAAARVALGQASAQIERTGEDSHTAEIHRLMGRAALAEGRRDEAEACFRRAYATAEQQGAHGWRLRAALDLAALLTERGEAAQARALVAAAASMVEGGAATKDVRDARRLLGRVESPPLS